MPKFSTHVALMSPEYRAVSFGPGDEVPEWALDSVGEHVLVPEDGGPADDASDTPNFTGSGDASDDESDGADASDDEEESDDEQDANPADVPNFTAPAPVRRGRTRKQ